MLNLREQLRQCFEGRVCFVGVGNVDSGDDGFGMRLAEALSCSVQGSEFQSAFRVVTAGTAPECVISRVADAKFDHVIFLDAVDFGGSPGATVLLDSQGIAARFPQISTHQLSLGLLARQVEANRTTKTWLLGVQPQVLRAGCGLSSAVRTTLELLRQLIAETATEVMA